MKKKKQFIPSVLILGSLIGNTFELAAGITVSDIFCVIVFFIVSLKILSGKWHLDMFVKMTITYFLMMLFSTSVNGTFFNTSFINYARIYFWGCIVYLFVINTFRTSEDILFLCKTMLVFLLYYVFEVRNIMNSTFDTEVTSIHEVDFFQGRNTFGFTAVLFLVFVGFMYYKRIYPRYLSIVLVVFLLGCSYFSFSRLAIYLSAASVVLYLLLIEFRHLSFKTILLYGLLLILIPVVINIAFDSVSLSVLESGKNLIEQKMGDTGSDFWDVRIMWCNVEPITKKYGEFGLLQTLIGDGISIQHSFISHSLINTGLIGFVIFSWITIYPIIYYFRKGTTGKFLSYLMMIMLYNDFITNARFIIQINMLLYMISCAVFVSLINKSNYEVILSNRIYK